LKSDSLPHAHALTTKTYYKHQDSRIKKAQELKTKTSANSDIKDKSSKTKLRGRLLESFQEDAKYEHVGQDTRSQDAHNELVQLFRTARDKCRELDILEFKIRLYNTGGARGYELPTSNTLGVMVFESGISDNANFDVIIQHRDGPPQRVNKLHPLYMSLQFLLLFIYGQPGYHTELTLKSANGVGRGKRVTMLAYYRYHLHFRLQQYDLLFRGGGPRYMYAYYLDALAIYQKLGNPQFFITFTCNVKWPEIKRFMSEYPHLTASNRVDVVCQVFQQKIQALIAFHKEERIFGDVTRVLYTVEFQKRGLPHCHTLLWVDSVSRTRIVEDVDRFILAELPDPRIDPEGYNVVSELMMHGPCGAASTKAPCMKGDKCAKNFPKKFNQKTFFDENGHVHYRRRDTSVSATRNEFQLDNSYVVPYNRNLLLAFRAYINVEYYGWSMLIKYLFKYISKGTYRVFARVSRPIGESSTAATPSRQVIDEIQNYVEGRSICAHEVYRRILKFDIHRREPVVQILVVHLEDMHRITFRDQDRLKSVIDLPEKKSTTLTKWFAFNEANEVGMHLSYLEFSSEFVWYSDRKSWSPRKNSKSSIGRLAYVHPPSGELFFLRMLLCHQKRCRDFWEVQTVNGVFYPTYKAACQALGLLGDDKELEIAFEEACGFATPEELRFLFSHILLYYDVADPSRLWKKIILSNYGKSLHAFGLPPPPQDLLAQLANRLLMEERNYNREELVQLKDESVPLLNAEQRQIYDLIINADTNNRQELIFVYGQGGTGKTFLWKTIISSLRSEGKIVLAVASSGIASLLLPSGLTAHSRFKLPLELTEESLCRITKNTQLGKLLANTDLIIWDEAPMNDRRCFEALDRSLRDIVDKPSSLFGKKSVLLGGDFRQTLPVKKGVSKIEVISSCISESALWPSFKVFTLKHNMRLARPDISLEERSLVNSFASWLLDISDRKIGEPTDEDLKNTSWVHIPHAYCLPPDEQGLSNLIDFIYDQSTLYTPSATTLQQKAIVCPKNEIVDIINSKFLAMV
ncbi:DNA helicase, partial [Tanacetum coccineum]